MRRKPWHRGVSLPAGSILKKLLHQKTFILLRSAQVTKIDFHDLSLLAVYISI
jgi:hypothetical protein